MIAERLEVPVLLDAGIGTASDAALAMELGLRRGALRLGGQPRARPRGDGHGGPPRRRGGAAGASAPGRIPLRTWAEASSPALGLPGLAEG